MKKKTYAWWEQHCPECGRISRGGKPCADGRCKPIIVKQDLSPAQQAFNEKFDKLVLDALVPDIRQQKHYNQYKIQPITFIVENGLSFCAGNAIKYILRHKEKNGIEDLEKAKVYIDYMIEEIKTGTVKP